VLQERILRHLVFSVMIVLAPYLAGGQAKVADLAVPPANAEHFTIMSTAGVHGHSARWTAPDGSLMGRESLLLRGQASELDSKTHLGADHMIDSLSIRGFTPQGDAAETFSIDKGIATWKSPVDAASTAYTRPALYSSFGGPIDEAALLAEAALAAPDHAVPMLPGGVARLEKLTSLTVGEGAEKKTVTAYAMSGIGNTPFPIWMDEKGKFFALDGGLTWIPAGYESFQPQLDKAQDEALAVRSRLESKQLATSPAGPLAFTHVRSFVDGSQFVEDETIVVDKGIITQVGPSATTQAPAEARIIDGKGKALVPGLWDAHQHVSDDASATMLLALGITSVRDPGNNNALTLARAERRARSELLMPHVYPSVLIDGKGPNTAQLGSVATSQEEALAFVRKAKAEGFTGIKFYGTFNPAWVAATAAEAHQLGLHVHGHIPAGMRTMDAINDGYDEITHIYFVMMQAMPQSVVDHSNGIERLSGPGRYAKDVDLNADPMKSLIATMAQRKIASDPTLVVVETLLVPNNGDLSASYAPYTGTLPVAMERGFRQGGLTVPPDLTRADLRASFAKMCALVEAMHKAGVPIVAGTDGTGLELVHELELYVQAGFSPEDALASATIVPARLVGADSKTGSIAVGKAADLVLVDGDPAHNMGDLRQTRMILMDGKVLDADAIRTASGISGRAHIGFH
jgi:imidazolonepropionase-like amidohydrolase